MSKPNILIFMVDQLNGTLFPDGPAEWLHAPNLKKLAARSTRFKNAYTASPLCAPGRAAFMSGQLPSDTGVYDNAAEFISSIPTYAHHLRRAGYQTCLSGKMHFVGPDQMHGFEERLTTDIYPADFGWTPDYRKPGERIDWWYHNMGSVTGSGVAEISNQMEYDDEVAYHATRKVYDYARSNDERPWCMTVSLPIPMIHTLPAKNIGICMRTVNIFCRPFQRWIMKITTPILNAFLMRMIGVVLISQRTISNGLAAPILPTSAILMIKSVR